MEAPETTMTQKGQVTIPVAVRRMLGLKPGDRVRFLTQDGRTVVERAESTLRAGFGAVTPVSRPEDFRARREEFENGIAEDARRGLD